MAAIEKTVNIIGDDAFCALILGRSIPDGMPVDFYDDILTKLRPHALRNMSGLESVYFPNVTYLGKYALAECPDLKRVDMPKVTSLTERAVFSCPSLVEVNFPMATSIGEFAITGGSIKRIELPSAVSANGTLQFYSCTSLEEIILIGGATILNGASSMEVVNIGPNITTINANAFGGAPAGMVVNLPKSEGEIAGAPWGGVDIVIHYDTPYAGTVPIPES